MDSGFGRNVGVRVPAGQRVEPEQGPPNKVVAVIPMRNIGVRYTDGAGQVHQEVWSVATDGTIYKHPNSEEWSGQLRTVKDSLAKQVLAELKRLDAPDAGVPETDAVEVVTKEVAEEKPAVDV